MPLNMEVLTASKLMVNVVPGFGSGAVEVLIAHDPSAYGWVT
jgi:hypothetical protein